jgi:hypothetical protein
MESTAMIIDSDTILVQDVKEKGVVDLYIYSHSQNSYELIYQNVEKVLNLTNTYINLNSDLSEYSDEYKEVAEKIKERYLEASYPFITSIIEQNNKIIINFVANRNPLEE